MRIQKRTIRRGIVMTGMILICFMPVQTRTADKGFDSVNCTFNGIPLHGKVKVVDHFPDIKVQVVTAFPDLRVKWVDHFPDACGEWQSVEHFPDFTIQYVDHFPDLKIRVVEHFPGTD